MGKAHAVRSGNHRGWPVTSPDVTPITIGKFPHFYTHSRLASRTGHIRHASGPARVRPSVARVGYRHRSPHVVPRLRRNGRHLFFFGGSRKIPVRIKGRRFAPEGTPT